jgi:hypothetical protein
VLLRTLLIFLIVPGIVAAQVPDGPKRGRVAQLANATDLRDKLGLTNPYRLTTGLGRIKIAVLDYGFDGFDPERPCLPGPTTVVEHYDPAKIKQYALGDPDFRKGFEPNNSHGRQMAQAVWAVTNFPTDGPQFFLLNANGPTLFRRAVREAIDQKVDIILFSGHFEGGGNYDGKGTINAAVSEAIKAGIIWVNATGNHHGRVYTGPVDVGPDGSVNFGKSKSKTLTFLNRLDENTFTITLTWNDYKDMEDAGTIKDLDLLVEDADGRVIAKGEFKQIAVPRPAGDGESKNPRERVIIPDLAKGTYRLRVNAKSGTFDSTDRLRVLLSPSRGESYPHPDVAGKMINPVQFEGATNAEELFPPADHPRVITVGEQSDYSALGPTADRRVKPDVLLPVLPARWTNGEVLGGTSYAAAYFAGVLAVLKASQPNLTGDDVMRWIRTTRNERKKSDATPVTVSGRTSFKTPMATPKPAPGLWRTPTATELANLVKH